MGDDLHEVEVPAFYMARYPVTAAQFRAFVEASGYKKAHLYSLRRSANEPVTTVDWNDAVAYCQWLGERLCEMARKRQEKPVGFWGALAAGDLAVGLPSEEEWEKAARGTDGRVYPWGNEEDPNRANCKETGLARTNAVGCFPGGISPYGCEDMSGNVLEWTRSLWEAESEGSEASSRNIRVLRGGAFSDSLGGARCACLDGDVPGLRSGSIGFRVVLSPFRSGL